MTWALTGLGEPVDNEDGTFTYAAEFHDDRQVDQSSFLTITEEENINDAVNRFLAQQNKYHSIEPDDLVLLSQLIACVSDLAGTILTNAGQLAAALNSSLPIFAAQQVLFAQQKAKVDQIVTLLQARE